MLSKYQRKLDLFLGYPLKGTYMLASKSKTVYIYILLITFLSIDFQITIGQHK